MSIQIKKRWCGIDVVSLISAFHDQFHNVGHKNSVLL